MLWQFSTVYCAEKVGRGREVTERAGSPCGETRCPSADAEATESNGSNART